MLLRRGALRQHRDSNWWTRHTVLQTVLIFTFIWQVLVPMLGDTRLPGSAIAEKQRTIPPAWARRHAACLALVIRHKLVVAPLLCPCTSSRFELAATLKPLPPSFQ